MAYDCLTQYTDDKADRFVADSGDDVIYRGDYYNRPNNLEMLGRIMPEFAEVLVEAYNHTPDELARAVISCSYCCDQIARGDITAREVWQQAYRGARCLHQLAADILSDGFSYDVDMDSVIANSPSGKYNRPSYGFVAHTYKVLYSKHWVEALYEIPAKIYDGEKRKRIYQEHCMRRTHAHRGRKHNTCIWAEG